ncbi:MAG TPA: hypothetical protein VFT99_12950, partial [Roseiflexaceae bacterium]|nr:hypothetical protein [Roseiflexaceae bacterium]
MALATNEATLRRLIMEPIRYKEGQQPMESSQQIHTGQAHTGEQHAMSNEMHMGSYGRFAAMIATSTVVMFGLMY